MSAVELVVFYVTTLVLSQLPSPSSETTPVSTETTVSKVEPAEGVRSTQVTVTGTNFPTEKKYISVRLNEKPVDPDSIISISSNSFVFRIPSNLPLGKYVARAVLTKDGKKIQLDLPTAADDKRLRILSDLGEPVKVTAVYPLVTYPDNDTFGFQIIGEGFSPVAEDNLLVIDGREEVPFKWVSEAEAGKRKKTDRLTAYRSSSRQLEFWGCPKTSMQGQ